ncbi:hypothetical protein [Bacillus mycoides]
MTGLPSFSVINGSEIGVSRLLVPSANISGKRLLKSARALGLFVT